MRAALRTTGLSFVFAIAAVAAAQLAPAQTTRGSSSKERRYFSARHGVGIEAPPGWTLSQHTGYPSVLVALVHPGGSRISLAVDKTAASDATDLVKQSKPGLAAQGLSVERVYAGPHAGMQIDARSDSRRQALRQLYIVRDLDAGRDGKQAIVLTLAAPFDQLAGATGPYEWVLGHLALETPMRPDSKADNKPDGGR